jgi:uncharacterized protein (TIGR01777 family)
MKIVLAGGSGQVGTLLARGFAREGHELVILTRDPGLTPSYGRPVLWDAVNLGDWCGELEGAHAVIGLAGRSVNCRYNIRNRNLIKQSRTASVMAIGKALRGLKSPPPVWLQSSTATIYRHTFGAAHSEAEGEIGGGEPGAPETWDFSIDVAKGWEADAMEFNDLPSTRLVLLRSAMTTSPDRGGVFDVLSRLVKLGLGGKAGDGRQFVSWIHEEDFLRSVRLLIDDARFSGPVNVCAPNPLPNREFMRILRARHNMPLGIGAAGFVMELGAWLMQTESELILKSRRVVPTRLLESGFTFKYPDWDQAAADLVERSRKQFLKTRS